MSTTSLPLTKNLKEFLGTGDLSDLTLICDGEEIKVHKVILAASSPVFRMLLTGKYKEASEAKGTLVVHHDLDAMKTLINFLYCPVWKDSYAADDNKICFVVRVYAIADYYQVDGLRFIAAGKFNVMFNPTKSNQHDFLNAITLVLEQTHPNDTTLEDIMMPRIKNNMKHLLEIEEFRNLILGNPELNFRLLSMDDKPTDEGEGATSYGGRRLGGK